MTAIADSPRTTTLNWERVARAGMHPIAVAVLELLAVVADNDSPERSPKQLADVLNEPLGVVSYHVRMLKGRGMVTLARTEPRRGALQRFYRLADLAVA